MATSNNSKASKILGVNITGEYIENDSLISFVNPFSLLELVNSDLTDEQLGRIRFYSDGVYLCFIARLFSGEKFTRYGFDYASLANSVFHDANLKQQKVAFVGGAESVIQKFSVLTQTKYPDMKVVYSRNGFFKSSDEWHESISELINIKADIVVVGMGAVMQEKFILALADAGFDGTAYTCGGFFDQTVCVNGEPYFPKWSNDFHLRWLYRLCKEPKRLFGRYFLNYPLFLFYFFLYKSKRP